MKELNLQQLESLEGGRRFWGKEYDGCRITARGPERFVRVYRFGILVRSGWETFSPSGACGA